MTKNEI